MKAFNLQQHISKGNKLFVDELFYSIQTEGPLAGRPAFFVRLYGCNLQCNFCDTLPNKPKKLSVKKIIRTMQKTSASRFVVITGGEPFLQNINPLMEAIVRKGFYIQIETNGTLDIQEKKYPRPFYSSPNIFIVVSPKTKKVEKRIAENALAFKYVIRAGKQGNDGLPKGLYKPDNKTKIMVSPCFEKDPEKTKENFKETIEICKNFGFYLSIQYHKWDLINIR